MVPPPVLWTRNEVFAAGCTLQQYCPLLPVQPADEASFSHTPILAHHVCVHMCMCLRVCRILTVVILQRGWFFRSVSSEETNKDATMDLFVPTYHILVYSYTRQLVLVHTVRYTVVFLKVSAEVSPMMMRTHGFFCSSPPMTDTGP